MTYARGFALLFLILIQPALARTPASTNAKTVDQLFAKWDKPGSPGGAIAIIHDGKIVYSHAYGLANLDYGIRNTTATEFDIGSLSKQFTSFSIYLLAQDGKLSIDDDVRKYIPELHDFEKTITIRNLLNHTSGLRDQMHLLILSGRRWDDAITQDDILKLLWREKELNFPTGDQYLYSNTNYVLLGLIVTRVSGMSLREFTEQRIFQPLGMTHTHFQDDYGVPMKNRANSYWTGPSPYSGAFAYKQEKGKYKYLALSNSMVGHAGLFTTVADWALWDENFYDGRVGGKALIADMETKAHLNSGKEIKYGAGLGFGQYRGLNVVTHSGGDAAYTSNIIQFPQQHFSVIILANTGSLDLWAISVKIADRYLDGKFPESKTLSGTQTNLDANVAPKTMQNTPLTVDQIRDFVGNYYSDELNVTYEVREKNGGLVVSYSLGDYPIEQVGSDAFVGHFPMSKLQFTRGQDGQCNGFTITDDVRSQNVPFAKISFAN